MESLDIYSSINPFQKFPFIIPSVTEEWFNPATLLSRAWKITTCSSFPAGVNYYLEFLSSSRPSLAVPIKYSIWDVNITWINQLCDIRANYIQILSIASKNWLCHSWDAQGVMQFLRQTLTSLDGFLSTSPTPPPFRRPWFNTVTMHMSRVSQVLSIPSSSSSPANRRAAALGTTASNDHSSNKATILC